MSLLTSAAEVIAQKVEAAPVGVKDKILDLWHKTTSGAVTSVEKAVGFGSQDPAKLSIVARGAVHGGINPDEIFDHDIIRRMDASSLAVLRRNLKAEFIRIYGNIDAASTFKSNGSTEDQVMAQSVINQVSDFFGVRSEASIISLHTTLRMFMGMDEKTVIAAMQVRSSIR